LLEVAAGNVEKVALEGAKGDEMWKASSYIRRSVVVRRSDADNF
jgi:hypothetical protein